MMRGNRPSLLPIARFCGASAALSEAHGAGRAAAMGRAFHAWIAKQPEAPGLLALLTDEERAEVTSWQLPATVLYADGVVLDYESAAKEQMVGLDDFGEYVDPASGVECLTHGTLDFAWVREVSGLRVAFLEDVKKTAFSSEGPDSLQLACYAWAWARKHGCSHYVTGLWLATEGEHRWSDEMVELDSDKGRAIWERIYHAASNTSEEYSTGPHCKSCYGRLHCQEWVFPAAVADTRLAPVASGVVPDSAGAADLLLWIAQYDEVTEKAKKNLQEWIRRGQLRVEKDGKMYVPVECKGRKSVDQERLKEVLGPKAEQFYKQGAPYQTFRWINSKEKTT